MKRHQAFVSLSRDHHDGLLLATRLMQGHKALLRLWSHDLAWQAAYVVKFFNENLEEHFRIEEASVFPLARHYLKKHEAILQGLLEEHGEMREMVNILRRPREQQLADTLANFGEILERHIRTEERKLFPMCEEQIPASELDKLGKEITPPPRGA